MGALAVTPNCAPPTASLASLGSRTSTGTVTVSPALASTLWICQITAPSGAVTGRTCSVTLAVVVLVSAAVVDVSAAVVDVSADVVESLSLVVDVSSSTMILPSTSVTSAVMSFPFVSLMNALDHSTGYSPAAVP